MIIMYSPFSQEGRLMFSFAPNYPIAYEIISGEHTIRRGHLHSGGNLHHISINGLPEGKYRFETGETSFVFEKREVVEQTVFSFVKD
jgi:hypothetical protein